MNAFDILGDPIRRRLLELLAEQDLSAGELTLAIQSEFGISQPAVSRHLRVLRESGFTSVRPEGTRRLYALDPNGLNEIDEWINRVRRHWEPKFAALETEIFRGNVNKGTEHE